MPNAGDVVAWREGGVVVAHWREMGTFRSDRTPRFRPEPGLPSLRAIKMEEGPVRALERYINGSGSLHASAVVLESAAVAFLGESGAGKSTAASVLCAERGAELLADDVLPILLTEHSGADAEVGDTSLWLLPAGTADARRKVASRPRAANGVFPLKLLVRLVPDSGDIFRIRRLRGAEALRGIAAAWIRFPLGYDDRDFALIAKLYSRLTLVEVTRPRYAGQEILLSTLETVFREFLGATNAE